MVFLKNRYRSTLVVIFRIKKVLNQAIIDEGETLPLHSRGFLVCLANSPGCENVLPHFSQPKGFCPIWDLMWLFSVVAPTNAREQKPHLNGFSLECEMTCARRSEELEKAKLHCPHWYGLAGWHGHMCSCSATRWEKVLWHCWQRHDVISPRGGLFANGTGLHVFPGSLMSLSKSLTGEDRWSENLLSVDELLVNGIFASWKGGLDSCSNGCTVPVNQTSNKEQETKRVLENLFKIL